MSSGSLLPNLLTLARLLLTPFIAMAILRRQYAGALVVLFVAGLTDWIDGYLARRLGAISRFGAYLDPIADKVLLSTIYLCLGLSGGLPWWLVILVFGRDVLILVLAAGFLLLTSVRKFSPSIWGKASTFAQIVTAVAVLMNLAGPAPWKQRMVEVLVWCVAAATAWSGLHYLSRAVRMTRAGGAAE